MKSLREHRVYEQELGRTVESKKATVPDIIANGLSSLSIGKSHQEYNESFKNLQTRRRSTPLIGHTLNTTGAAQATATNSPSVSHQSPLPSLHTISHLQPAPTTTSTNLGNADDSFNELDASDEDEDIPLDLDARNELLTLVTESDVELELD